jgi:hypothetical protein
VSSGRLQAEVGGPTKIAFPGQVCAVPTIFKLIKFKKCQIKKEKVLKLNELSLF